MPNPAELPLQYHVFGHVNVSSSMTGFDMSDLVPPPDAKDAFETAHVEGLQSLYVTTIWGSCLTAIQEDRGANGISALLHSFQRAVSWTTWLS